MKARGGLRASIGNRIGDNGGAGSHAQIAIVSNFSLRLRRLQGLGD